MESLELIITIALIVLIAIIAIIVSRNLAKSKKIRIEKENRFIKILVNCLSIKTIKNLEDIKDFFMAHFEKDTVSTRGLLFFLQKAKLEISQLESPHINEENRANSLNFLTEQIVATELLIKKQEEEQPFQRVNGFEKSLLLELNLITKGKEHEQLVYQKLTDLSKILITRQETVDKLTQDNRVALTNSRWSITITIIVSIISVILGIYAYVQK